MLALTTVAGNVGLEQATRNALLTAEICGSDAPVFIGADRPLTRAHEHAHWFHGKDGLGDRGYPAPKRDAERERAVEAILPPRAGRARPDAGDARPAHQYRARARARSGARRQRIGRCVVMGGAPCCEGNVTPAAEYNIWVDPEAARAVFRSKPPDRDDRLARLARPLGAEGRRDRGDRGARHGEGQIRHRIRTAAPARPIGSRPARSASRSPTRPPWRSRSTARSASPGRAIGWRSNVRSELTRGMTVVDRLNVRDDANNAPVWGERRESDGAAASRTFTAARRLRAPPTVRRVDSPAEGPRPVERR